MRTPHPRDILGRRKINLDTKLDWCLILQFMTGLNYWGVRRNKSSAANIHDRYGIAPLAQTVAKGLSWSMTLKKFGHGLFSTRTLD